MASSSAVLQDDEPPQLSAKKIRRHTLGGSSVLPFTPIATALPTIDDDEPLEAHISQAEYAANRLPSALSADTLSPASIAFSTSSTLKSPVSPGTTDRDSLDRVLKNPELYAKFLAFATKSFASENVSALSIDLFDMV